MRFYSFSGPPYGILSGCVPHESSTPPNPWFENCTITCVPFCNFLSNPQLSCGHVDPIFFFPSHTESFPLGYLCKLTGFHQWLCPSHQGVTSFGPRPSWKEVQSFLWFSYCRFIERVSPILLHLTTCYLTQQDVPLGFAFSTPRKRLVMISGKITSTFSPVCIHWCTLSSCHLLLPSFFLCLFGRALANPAHLSISFQPVLSSKSWHNVCFNYFSLLTFPSGSCDCVLLASIFFAPFHILICHTFFFFCLDSYHKKPWLHVTWKTLKLQTQDWCCPYLSPIWLNCPGGTIFLHHCDFIVFWVADHGYSYNQLPNHPPPPPPHFLSHRCPLVVPLHGVQWTLHVFCFSELFWCPPQWCDCEFHWAPCPYA